MEFKDYYAVLEVPHDADAKAIKTAFRKMARLYHPDVSQHPEAEAKFKDVAEAYEVLHNPEKRAEYDELCAARKHRSRGGSRASGSTGGSGDQDFADFFNSIFGGAGPGFGRQQEFYGSDPFAQGSRARPGRDLELEWPVMLEETLADANKPIEYTVPYVDERGQAQQLKKSLRIKIPAGVTEGERIRIKGQGAPGIGEAPNGDLYLHIRLVPHPLFDVEGHNLILAVPLAPWEAVLGAKITLPTLSGKVQLTIPPGSQAGQRMRIKGKGLVGKQGRGDLYAVLKITTPPSANAAAQQLWQELASNAQFNPRAEWSSSL